MAHQTDMCRKSISGFHKQQKALKIKVINIIINEIKAQIFIFTHKTTGL
jgi:predicted transposase YbfD/YdcC